MPGLNGSAPGTSARPHRFRAERIFPPVAPRGSEPGAGGHCLSRCRPSSPGSLIRAGGPVAAPCGATSARLLGPAPDNARGRRHGPGLHPALAHEDCDGDGIPLPAGHCHREAPQPDFEPRGRRSGHPDRHFRWSARLQAGRIHPRHAGSEALGRRATTVLRPERGLPSAPRLLQPGLLQGVRRLELPRRGDARLHRRHLRERCR